MKELINTWKEGKALIGSAGAPAQIIAEAKEKKRRIRQAHYGTLLVLVVTLVALALYGYFLLPPSALWAVAGLGTMVCALALRIGIEVASAVKWRRVKFSDDAVHAGSAAQHFYHFRKKIHGPVTLVVVILYVAGFYLLAAGFGKHLSRPMLLFVHGSFIVGAIAVIALARTGIRKEMADLRHLAALTGAFTDDAKDD